MDDNVDACMVGTGYLNLGFDARALEAIEHDLLEALPHFGVVPIARDINEARIKTMIGIAADEHAHSAALVQVDYAPSDANQVIDARLEELVARVGFQDIEYRLAVVARRVETEVFDDAIDLAPQNGDIAWRAMVGSGGPQAQKAVFTVDFAAIVKGFDADVVEVLTAMYGRC